MRKLRISGSFDFSNEEGVKDARSINPSRPVGPANRTKVNESSLENQGDGLAVKIDHRPITKSHGKSGL